MRSEKIMELEYTDLRNAVYKKLEEMILSGEIKPKEKILENELAKKLGVSRTPIREALNKLEQKNLVVRIPHKGTYVREISLDEVEEIYIIRGLLEGNAVRIAATKISDDDLNELENILKKMKEALDKDDLEAFAVENEAFHNKITSYAGRLSLDLVANFRDRIARYRSSTTPYKERCEEAYKEHLEIFRAIKNKDPDSAEQAIIKHANNGLKKVKEILLRNSKLE